MSVALAPQARPPVDDSPDFSPFPSSPTGRPRSLDSQAKERICHWLRRGMSFKQAAAYVACHPETIRNERRRDLQFDFDVRRALAMREMEPLDTIRRQAKHSWRAAVWLINYRERKKAERDAKRAALPAKAIDDAADFLPTSPAPPPSPAPNPAPSDQTFSPSPPSAPKKVLDAMFAVMDKTLDEQRLTLSNLAMAPVFESDARRPTRGIDFSKKRKRKNASKIGSF